MPRIRTFLAGAALAAGSLVMSAMPAYAYTWHTFGTWSVYDPTANATITLFNTTLAQEGSFHYTFSGDLADNSPTGYCSELWVDYNGLNEHHNPYLFRNCRGLDVSFGQVPQFGAYRSNGPQIPDFVVCWVPSSVAPGQATPRVNGTNCAIGQGSVAGAGGRNNTTYTTTTWTHHQSPNGVIVVNL